jgi:hypothetical protein
LGALFIPVLDTAGGVYSTTITVVLAKWGGPVFGLCMVSGGMLVGVGVLDVSRTILVIGVWGPKLCAEAASGVSVAGRFLPPWTGTCGCTCPPQQMCAGYLF